MCSFVPTNLPHRVNLPIVISDGLSEATIRICSSEKFCNIHRKTSVLVFVVNNDTGIPIQTPTQVQNTLPWLILEAVARIGVLQNSYCKNFWQSSQVKTKTSILSDHDIRITSFTFFIDQNF